MQHNQLLKDRADRIAVHTELEGLQRTVLQRSREVEDAVLDGLPQEEKQGNSDACVCVCVCGGGGVRLCVPAARDMPVCEQHAWH